MSRLLSQVSVATGAGNVTVANPKSRGASATFMLVVQVISGRVVSTSVIVWLQLAALLQESVAVQVLVALKVFPTIGLVLVLTEIARLVLPQKSVAVGG